MANKFLSIIGLVALASRSMAGVATYAASPYTTYHYSAPAAAATVYHRPHPVVYHQSTSPAHAVVQTYNAPLLKTYNSAPVFQTYAGAPQTYAASSFAPLVRTYAAPTVVAAAPVAPVVAAPVVHKAAAVVAAPAAPAVVKSFVPASPVAVAAAPSIVKTVEYESAPRYDFSYGVHDSYTGDIKSQVESRNGGNVAGSYSVVDADGYKRTVTYTADDLNGFNAVVQREPIVKVAAVHAAVPAAVATSVHHVPLQQQIHAVPSAVATPVHHVPLQQQHIQYLPPQQQITAVQQQQHQQEYLPQSPIAPVQPEPASEPIPIEYPEEAQQQIQQQQPEQQFEQQQPQYPQDQQYPPYPQGDNNDNNEANNDDSDVVEVRAASASTVAPTPVNEEQKESNPTKRAF